MVKPAPSVAKARRPASKGGTSSQVQSQSKSKPKVAAKASAANKAGAKKAPVSPKAPAPPFKAPPIASVPGTYKTRSGRLLMKPVPGSTLDTRKLDAALAVVRSQKG